MCSLSRPIVRYMNEFQVEITYEGRQKMTALSGSFAQLMHKAQSMHHAMNRYEKVSCSGERTSSSLYLIEIKMVDESIRRLIKGH